MAKRGDDPPAELGRKRATAHRASLSTRKLSLVPTLLSSCSSTSYLPIFARFEKPGKPPPQPQAGRQSDRNQRAPAACSSTLIQVGHKLHPHQPSLGKEFTLGSIKQYQVVSPWVSHGHDNAGLQRSCSQQRLYSLEKYLGTSHTP